MNASLTADPSSVSPSAGRLLAGRVALVTGGASGIGRAACLSFAREGAAVCVADRDLDGAKATVAAIQAELGEALAIQADVASEEQVRGMLDQVTRHYGRVDCCFNNAGIGTLETHSRGKSLADVEFGDWQRMLAVNLSGVFLCLKYELKLMGQKGGSIVNTASIAGLTALPNSAAYVASKHGVVGLTRSAAIEYGHLGIRVNAVCPGHIATPLLGASDPEKERLLWSQNPMGRYGTAEEIAELAVWLSSDRASFINGAALTADGGRLAGR
ncbi:MAG: SDR family oxidoreductase [Ottowia sp.]|uniref:SDR family NAD(P)-dependent oxidoreductase n=1 Tax=Ottowia sp. TaxID=1898956 RepID=UPI003C73C3DC